MSSAGKLGNSIDLIKSEILTDWKEERWADID